LTELQKRLACRLFIGLGWVWVDDLYACARSEEWDDVRPALDELRAKGIVMKRFRVDRHSFRYSLTDAGRALFDKLGLEG
jgi:hypothetical protein